MTAKADPRALFPGLFDAAAGLEHQEPEPTTGQDLILVYADPVWPTFEEIAGHIPEGEGKAALVELREMARRYPVRAYKVETQRPTQVKVRLTAEPVWKQKHRDLWLKARRLMWFEGAWILMEEYMLFALPEEDFQ